MTRRDVQDLLELIRRFVDGSDRTKSVAADIEGLVIECFQDEAWFEELSESLALFVPGGSTPYIDEDQLAREIGPIAELLAASLEVPASDA
ncbi:MAG: hypothetical protein M5U19_00205 [Microthrixaceae bacterium]|nr:hypothetical protein [Microthrixaceae bacterium]